MVTSHHRQVTIVTYKVAPMSEVHLAISALLSSRCGGRALSVTAIRPSARLSVPALGAQLPRMQPTETAGYLQLSHVRTADPSADGRRSAASRTAIGGGAYRLAAPGAITVATLAARLLDFYKSIGLSINMTNTIVYIYNITIRS